MLTDAELVPAKQLKAKRIKEMPHYPGKHLPQLELFKLLAQLQEYCRQQQMVKEALLKLLDSDESPLAEAFAMVAADLYEREGELEADSTPRVSLSPSDDGKGIGGAYVQMWRYVSVDELPEDMQELAKETGHADEG